MATSLVIGERHSYWAPMAVALVIGRSRYAALSASRRRGSARTFGLARNSPWTGLGFWLLLAWTPDIVLAIDPRYRIAALVLLPLLFLWESWYPRIWLWLHDATRLVSAELEPGIAAITERA
jgi:hypothetical protein